MISLFILLWLITATKGDLLYPWGEEFGDIGGPSVKGFYPIQMNYRIRFFRQFHDKLSLCSRGEIGFEPVVQENFQYEQWPPFSCGDTAIVPFGVSQNMDIDAHYGSPLSYLFGFHNYQYDGSQKSENLWYRTTRNRTILQRAKSDIMDNFDGCFGRYKPKELFIATWVDVHDINRCEGMNDAQCECLMNGPFKDRDYLGFPYANEKYCDCVGNHADNLESCLCNDHEFYNYLMNGFYTDLVNFTLCQCLMYYDMDYCQCDVYGECEDSKRRITREQQENKTNTYQVVLITNGRRTYAMFNYQKIQWIYINTDRFLTGKIENFRDPVRKYATVGFYKDVRKDYHHPYSYTDDLYKLATESNVGIPGRWLYEISGKKIKAPGCVKLPLTSWIN